MQKININEIRENFKSFANLKFKDLENFEYFLLDRQDIEKLEPFFDEIEKEVSRDIYVRNTLQENITSFDRGGFVLAAFLKDEVVAVIILDAPYGEKPLPDFMDISKEDKYNSIIFDTICVLPKYWGNGLQEKLMCMAEYICYVRGYKYAFMSISPNNFYSLNNAFKQDFIIFTIEDLYAKDDKKAVTRYILSKVLGKRLSQVPEQYSVKNTDIQMQKEVISLGFVGMKVINFSSIDKFFVSYSKAFYDDYVS